MADIFISYASEDRPRAKLLTEVLTQQGWSVFWDRALIPGDKFRDVISKELNDAQCVIVLWSTTSISKDWVLDEAGESLKKSNLVPAVIENAVPPLGFRQLHAADLSRWLTNTDDQEISNLLRAVKAKLENASVISSNSYSAPSSKMLLQKALTGASLTSRLPMAGLVVITCLTCLLIAIPFLLVRMDVIDADWLRIIPLLVLILLAVFALVSLWMKIRGKSRYR